MEPILSFKGVSFSYEEPHHQLVVHNTSLDLNPGTFTVVVGPSGGGKSTILRLASGLVKPEHGSVSNTARTRMIFQDAALLPWLTVKENVEMGFIGVTSSKHEQHKKLHEELSNMNLLEHADKYPRDLSGGQRQRVGIARALVSDPEFLLLDEPFSALDVETTERLSEELLGIFAKRKITMLMVSHSIEDAVYLADQILVFSSATISHKVSVNLPRPRNRTSEHFEKLVKEVKNLIPKK